MIFARIGHGPCYYHWNEIFAGVLYFEKLSKVHQNKLSLFVLGINNILFNNVNSLAFLIRYLTADMKKVDNYALPEVIFFQNNEILKFWAFYFFLK